MGNLAVNSVVCLLAWVLWVDHKDIGIGDTKFSRSWTPEAAYTDDNHAQCIADAQIMAVREVEQMKKAANVKELKRVTLMGNQENVTIELKSGGTMVHTYVCFPDTITPEGAEASKRR